MTVKERLHRIIEALPEELPETAIEAAQNALHPYRETVAPANGARSETTEERRARIYALMGSMKHIPVSSEDLYRRKSEEIDMENERSARHLAGLG